jgi:putative ABC transport system substrate-binding protein
VNRRDFVTFLGGAVVACPLVARAQPPALPVVGVLEAGAPETSADLVAAFRKGLGESGYLDGRNVAVEFHWAKNDSSRLPELVADLVRRRVAIIAAPGNNAAAMVAKSATSAIPIVFSTGADPVEVGLVASLNRPGGNITGISYMNVELGAKRLGLLHELLPAAGRFALLVDPRNLQSQSLVTDLQSAAASIGRLLDILSVGTAAEINTAFAVLAQNRSDALLVSPLPFLYDRRVQILTLAARHAVPAIYPAREWAEAGGLMSYGSSYADQHRMAGVYTGRVLKGEKPADLPIMRATKFELVINAQTAKACGIDIPPTLLARADEVIE